MAANRAFQAMAKRRGVTFLQCGQDINPNNEADLYDGLHPTVPAMRKLLGCMAPTIKRLVGKP